MMPSEPLRPWWANGPRWILPAWIAVGMLCAVLPAGLWQPLRGGTQALLAPGQQVVARAGLAIDDCLAPWRALRQRAGEREQLQHELDSLRTRNQQLEVALWQLHDRLAEQPPPAGQRSFDATPPLVSGRLVEARVLGSALGPWLVRQPILDLPRGAWYEPGHPVVDPLPPVLDVGTDHELEPGLLVILGRRVWGRLSAVHGQSATVERTSDPAFRDVVCLARSVDGSLKRGAQALWQGTGGDTACLRMVPLSETVQVGDLVLADNHRPAADGAWLYGHVTHVDRAADATHWDIRVQTATRGEVPRRLAVFVPRIHPERLSRAWESRAPQ